MTGELDAAHRSARRFFRGWLVVASLFSMAANVAHTVLQVDGRVAWLAAAAALVPPSVQVAATHSISLLVRTRAAGPIYWSALVMTVVIGVFAFVLSFDAIRSLASTLGFTGTVLGWPAAAIFPLAIDISITHATICLLSTSPLPRRAPVSTPAPARVGRPSTAAPVAGGHSDHVPVSALVIPATGNGIDNQRDWALDPNDNPSAAPDLSVRTSSAAPAETPHRPANRSDDTARAERYLALAELLVRNKVTRKDTEVVAALLADGAAGLNPTAIADKRNVHHSVVTKVLHAASLQANLADAAVLG